MILVPQSEIKNGMREADRPLWRVSLLGDLRVVPDEGSDETCRRFRTHKGALLLARLLLYPARAFSRDELVDWLWTDAPADRGRANLSQTLLDLRKQFTPAIFVADHHTIRLQAAFFQTDVARFESLASEARRVKTGAAWEAAAQAWGGDLLPGFYDDWVECERRRLSALYEEARERSEAVARDHPAVLPETQIVGMPLTLTRFFGRETELARVTNALASPPHARLATLVGMGGIGKTRLALEAIPLLAADRAFGFIAFVPLADVSEAAHLPDALAQSLAVETVADADPLPLVIAFLCKVTAKCGRRVLLALDNLEQFGEDAAPLVARLLREIPVLTILATSRQPIGIAGEREIPLGPLTHEALALFADRARLARPDFAVTSRNEGEVRDLCALLEGVPLALELAGAWGRTLSPTQIAARLHDRFDGLALRGVFCGTAPKRHRSLHAAIGWSFDLLSPELQSFLVHLSVFRGGWTLEAAQAVTGATDATEPLLLLSERSLLFAEPDTSTGALRYRMLESLREFACEQARQRGGDFCAALSLRHARYFADLSREADAMTREGHGMRPALARLGPERENLRAVFAGLQEIVREEKGSADGDRPAYRSFIQAAVESIVQSYWLWSGKEMTLCLQGAMDALPRLPDETASRPLRAHVVALQGQRASLAGDYPTGERLLNESLALWKALGNKKEVATVKNYLAGQAWKRGDSTGAFAIWSENLRFARETGDLRMESAMLHNVALVGPDLAQRRVWIERAVALDRKHWPGSMFHACSVGCLSFVAREQDDLETAQACLEEAHEIAVADGARGTVAVIKQCLADFYVETNVPSASLERADELLHDAQSLYTELEEWPRIANCLLSRFRVALKRGDVSSALDFARDYLATNRDADLMDAAEQAAAREDIAKRLREAGCSADARPFWCEYL